jgi:predicted ATPase with chaperone activity
MLLRRPTTVLPDMTPTEAIETTCIHDCEGDEGRRDSIVPYQHRRSCGMQVCTRALNGWPHPPYL